jgi:hypothetical protein
LWLLVHIRSSSEVPTLQLRAALDLRHEYTQAACSCPCFNL